MTRNLHDRAGVSVLLLVLLLPSCATSRQGQLPPEAPIGPGGLTVSQIQSELMSFADNFTELVGQGADEIKYAAEDARTRLFAARIRGSSILSAITIASSPNPVVGVVDMTVMVTLSRQSAELFWDSQVFGDRGEPLVAALRRAEEQVWSVAASVLEADQVDDLHALIERWRNDHPRQVYVAYIRFEDFSPYRRAGITGNLRGRGSVFGLVGLDPLANLDPTTREIEQSRLLAERMFYFVSRLPVVFGWQAEVVAYDLLAGPQSQALLADVSAFRETAQRFAGTVEELPGRIGAEIERVQTRVLADVAGEADAFAETTVARVREAAAAEREALFGRLRSENDDLERTLAELRETIHAGTELSRSLQATTGSVDALAARFVHEPAPDREPVKLADVQATIEQTTLATMELQDLVSSLDSVMSSADARRLGEVLAAAEGTGRRLVNRVFLLAAGLVLLVFAAAVLKSYLARPAGGPRRQ